jgi:acyl-[acyl-carrier-protein]-phospholipid O-acyltransferase/long-chain-fatty-acid--[acyl-carrier-protein] ligase
VGAFILCAGFFAGFYIIPLQALLQKLSPADERGRFLGTSNGISFAFLALASLVYWIIRPGFGSAPQQVFLVCAGLILLGALLFLRQLRRIIFQREEAVQ